MVCLLVVVASNSCVRSVRHDAAAATDLGGDGLCVPGRRPTLAKACRLRPSSKLMENKKSMCFSEDRNDSHPPHSAKKCLSFVDVIPPSLSLCVFALITLSCVISLF